MAIPVDHLSAHLTLIEGGRAISQRRDEAHIEAIAFMDEVARTAARVVDAITALPVPSMVAINEVNRLAYRATLARNELLTLTTPDGSAA